MAGGRFVKGQKQTRPGTYTNFDDVSVYGSAGGSGGGSGGGGGGKPKDYVIGKIIPQKVSAASVKYNYSYPLTGEQVCGEND